MVRAMAFISVYKFKNLIIFINSKLNIALIKIVLSIKITSFEGKISLTAEVIHCYNSWPNICSKTADCALLFFAVLFHHSDVVILLLYDNAHYGIVLVMKLLACSDYKIFLLIVILSPSNLMICQ